jgi:hypothetical protein
MTKNIGVSTFFFDNNYTNLHGPVDHADLDVREGRGDGPYCAESGGSGGVESMLRHETGYCDAKMATTWFRVSGYRV